jgi:hypothetical protein
MITDNDCLTPLGLLLGSLNWGDYWPCHSYLALSPRATVWSWSYLGIFTLTVALEFPVYFAFLIGLNSPDRRRLLPLLKTCVTLNLATHPLIYLAFPTLFLASTYKSYLVAAEIFAPTFEAMLLATVFKRHWVLAIAAAISANLFSWWLGVYLT